MISTENAPTFPNTAPVQKYKVFVYVPTIWQFIFYFTNNRNICSMLQFGERLSVCDVSGYMFARPNGTSCFFAI